MKITSQTATLLGNQSARMVACASRHGSSQIPRLLLRVLPAALYGSK